VHAENMANAGSILLQMAAELKLSFVLQDLEAANADVDATNAALQDRCGTAHAACAPCSLLSALCALRSALPDRIADAHRCQLHLQVCAR